MKAKQIIELRDAGLISSREARNSLRRLANQAKFNADYSDTLASYKRWMAESLAARRALSNEPLIYSGGAIT